MRISYGEARENADPVARGGLTGLERRGAAVGCARLRRGAAMGAAAVDMPPQSRACLCKSDQLLATPSREKANLGQLRSPLAQANLLCINGIIPVSTKGAKLPCNNSTGASGAVV